MSDQFSLPIPPEYNDMKKKISDAFFPILYQQAKFKDIIKPASFTFPKIIELKNRYPGITQAVTDNSAPIRDYFQGINEQIHTSLSWWEETQKQVVEAARSLQDLIERAEQILLSEESPLKVWASYGWTISPGAMIRDYYVVPKSKEDADRYMSEIHDDDAIKKTIQQIRRSTFHSIQDIDDVEYLYNTGRYKACALLLFSLVDSLLIHTQDETKYAENRKQGNKGISRFEELVEPDDCQKLAFKVLCFIACTNALKAFFDETKNYQNRNPVLNRHLLCHGMLQREVNGIDCVQLMLLYENMLHCAGLV